MLELLRPNGKLRSSEAARRSDLSGRGPAGISALGLRRPLVPVPQSDVPELDPAAGVGAAAVELHRHGRRRRALDVRV